MTREHDVTIVQFGVSVLSGAVLCSWAVAEVRVGVSMLPLTLVVSPVVEDPGKIVGSQGW